MDNNLIKIEKNGETYDLHVMWSIHNKCNYQCSYCPSFLNDGSMTWMKLEHFKGFIDKIEKHYVNKLGHKNILFSFTGGEPTLWPDFREFLKYINDRGFRAGLTTNASVAVNYWKTISNYFDYICLSFHPEKAEIENFIKTFEFLHNAEDTVIPAVRVMMHPEQKYWDKSIEVIERLKKFPNWTYECVHILDDYGITAQRMDYQNEEKRKFIEENSFKSQFLDNSYVHLPKVAFNYKVEYENGDVEKLDENKLINRDLANFKDWDCFIGIDQIFIESHGIVKRAGCNVGNYLGSILEYEDIIFPDKPIKCDREHCHCPTDIRITKYAPGIAYEMKEIKYNSTIKKVKVTEGEYKYRIDLKLGENAKDQNEFVQNLLGLIQNICLAKLINENEIILNIEVENIDHLLVQKILRVVSNLTQVKLRFEYLKVSEKEFNDVAKTFYSCDKTIINLNGVEDRYKIVELLKESQKDYKKQLIVKIHRDDNYNMQKVNELISLLEVLICQIHFIGFSTEEIESIEKDKPEVYLYPNHGQFIYRKINYDAESISLRRSMAKMDSVSILNEDEEVFNSFSFKIGPSDSFNNWNCYQGVENMVIDDNGDIFSSFCAQKRKLGNLKSYEIEQISNMESIVCKQEKCNNYWDQIIKKEKI